MDKTAVGTGQHCTFNFEITGSDTVMAHLPNPVISLITAAFFCRELPGL